MMQDMPQTNKMSVCRINAEEKHGHPLLTDSLQRVSWRDRSSCLWSLGSRGLSGSSPPGKKPSVWTLESYPPLLPVSLLH